MTKRIPMVDYLDIDGPEPRLVARSCTSCGALYLDRRNACARCGHTSFDRRQLGTTGTVRAFTIVHRTAPTVKTPFVSAVVDLEGGGVVKGNLVGVEPDPAQITPGMPVALTTFVAGTDSAGTEAMAFAFTPATGDGNG